MVRSSEGNRFENAARGVRIACVLYLLVLIPTAGYGQQPIWVDFSSYDKSSGIQVNQQGLLLSVVWKGERGLPLRVRFNLADLSMLIRDLSVSSASGFVPILENASPEYMCF